MLEDDVSAEPGDKISFQLLENMFLIQRNN